MTTDLSQFAFMDRLEKELLAELSSSLPENAVIVEVGTFMGGSASILANANPSATVTCYDLYEDDPHKRYRAEPQYKLFDQMLGMTDAPRTFENVKKLMSGIPNVVLNKCKSPDGITWDKPIDLYFEDGIHMNPRLNMNIEFWRQHIKIGGYLVLHDYRPHFPADHYWRWPDVETEFARLLTCGYRFMKHVISTLVLVREY